MHEIILTQNTTILERMAAATINSLSGAAMHLFPNLYVRPSTLFVKNLGKRNLTVVEIGTDKGYNAKTILDNLDVGMMYLIDPYLESSLQGSSIAFEMAKKRLKKYENKIRFVKQKSEDAAEDIPAGVDFLYIDGNHAKKQVALELNLFYPKMKKGGVIAGHDFMGGHIDLTEAVVEFKQKYNLKLYGGSYDFWMVKP
jgi:hypothetical protein